MTVESMARALDGRRSVAMTAEVEHLLEVDRVFFRLHPDATFLIRPPFPFELGQLAMEGAQVVLVTPVSPGVRVRRGLTIFSVRAASERTQ